MDDVYTGIHVCSAGTGLQQLVYTEVTAHLKSKQLMLYVIHNVSECHPPVDHQSEQSCCERRSFWIISQLGCL